MRLAVQYRKLFGLAILLAAALSALGYRLFDLQVVRHDELRERAERNTRRVIAREPLRGRILDARGNLLATSIPSKIVCADPTLIGGKQTEVARVLAPLLQTNESYLVERLMPQVRPDGKTNRYVVLRRKVPVETWSAIETAMARMDFGVDESKLKGRLAEFYRALHHKAIFSEEDQIRLYPNHRLASHVIGFVSGDEQQSGVNGIERYYNSELAGVRGWRRIEQDKRQRELVSFRDQDVEAHDGMNVVLTIDARLQDIVESELVEATKKHNPASLSCLVVRPRTGEILAMATLPNYDPNTPGAFRDEALKNRVICDIIEPGSTFKIVVVSGGLNEKVIKLTDVFDCERGAFHYAGHTLRDHESYGSLSVENIIKKSSNIGAAKIAIERLHEQKLYEYIRKFGFGERTGIPLPGEVNGLVYSPANKRMWTKLTIAQIPMGHGVAVTPLQMTMAMSAIANDGILMRPMLVDRFESEDGRVVKYNPEPVRRVITEAAAKQMLQALKTVVAPDGTAPKAHLENYLVAGKTGTAQKAENGRYGGKYVSSFIGFFPADRPELCISVIFDEPRNGHYGGQVAAPVFKSIAERAAKYLNIKPDVEPDKAVKELLLATLAAEKQAQAEKKAAEPALKESSKD